MDSLVLVLLSLFLVCVQWPLVVQDTDLFGWSRISGGGRHLVSVVVSWVVAGH